MIQDKAQSAGNGMSFSRTATPYWIIWQAPFGRAVKRSSALLRLLARGRAITGEVRLAVKRFTTRWAHQYILVGPLGHPGRVRQGDENGQG